ncbi:MAG: hypothetical protein ABR549_02630 [Mycobacteriales bacterium]
MLVYAVIAALAVFALLLAVPLVRRNHRLDEVDRFHVARSLTTAWSTQPTPQIRVPAEGEDLTQEGDRVRSSRRNGRKT